MDDPQRFLPLSPHQFHILLALTDRDRHGYALIQDIAQRTDGALRLGTGTLYTAIARLVELGLIADAGRPPGKELPAAARSEPTEDHEVGDSIPALIRPSGLSGRGAPGRPVGAHGP